MEEQEATFWRRLVHLWKQGGLFWLVFGVRYPAHEVMTVLVIVLCGISLAGVEDLSIWEISAPVWSCYGGVIRILIWEGLTVLWAFLFKRNRSK